MRDADVIAHLDRALARGDRAALAVLTHTEASSPGVAGSMMVVLADGERCGTVGGGAIEADVVRRCLEALRSGGADFPFAYDLSRGGELGMACGGTASGFVKLFAPRTRVILFGGGHIGTAVCRIAQVCGFDVTVVDDRALPPEGFDGAHLRLGCDIAEAARDIDVRGAYALIATHGHAHDAAALAGVVDRGAAYVGMIGSRAKVGATLQRLRDEGTPAEALEAVYAPVGLDIDDGSPAEIAVAVVAEMLAVKNGGRLRHGRERMAGETGV